MNISLSAELSSVTTNTSIESWTSVTIELPFYVTIYMMVAAPYI